jgi:4-hydroxybenzoate polyprenyltransferase
MNKFFQYLIISVVLNSIAIVLLFAIGAMANLDLSWAILVLLLTGISLFVQFVVAFTFMIDEKKRTLGQAMFTSVGIILLIGFSICSGAFR